MLTLFCQNPLRPRQVDEDYQREALALATLGRQYALISFEALVNDHDPARAVQRIEAATSPTLALYRGWMLTPAQYAALYAALAEKNIQLINAPAAYRHCHYLPEAYASIAPHTPKTVWLPLNGPVSIDEVMALLQPFGTGPVLLKDYVKSQKHYWHEACFIPSAVDRPAVERVVNRFLALQGENLNEGLVFREFVPLARLVNATSSKLPLSIEFRIFVLDGQPLSTVEYWEEGQYPMVLPPVNAFQDLMRQIPSRFYTMDIAQCTDGLWQIIELGDAQVAGLPAALDVAAFYQKLLRLLAS